MGHCGIKGSKHVNIQSTIIVKNEYKAHPSPEQLPKQILQESSPHHNVSIPTIHIQKVATPDYSKEEPMSMKERLSSDDLFVKSRNVRKSEKIMPEFMTVKATENFQKLPRNPSINELMFIISSLRRHYLFVEMSDLDL